MRNEFAALTSSLLFPAGIKHLVGIRMLRWRTRLLGQHWVKSD
jgi:hypothetical protein